MNKSFKFFPHLERSCFLLNRCSSESLDPFGDLVGGGVDLVDLEKKGE